MAERTWASTADRLLQSVIFVLAVGLTLYTFWHANSLSWERTRFANLFLGAGLALFYLHQFSQLEWHAFERSGPIGTLRDVGRRIDYVTAIPLGVVAAACSAYVELNWNRLVFDVPVYGANQVDLVVGAAIIVIVIDATRRAYGWAISVFALATVGYAFLGPFLPGVLRHSGMTLENVIYHGAIGLSGVYGFILGVGTTWVAIFIMFAGIAKVYGALDYVIDVGQEIGKNLESGVVHIAVISSMIMGSITGSSAANTATTGSFTIPMMIDQGVREDFAAAIEAVASSGGQMLPPVMGVAAFLMADLLGVPYVRVIAAGLLPALLFYVGVTIAVHLTVMKFGWTSEQTAEVGLLHRVASVSTLVTVGYVLLGGLTFAVGRGLLATVDVAGVDLSAAPSLGLGPLEAAGLTVAVLLAVRLVHALAATATTTTAPRQFVAGAWRDFVKAVRRFFKGGHFVVPMLVLLYTLVVLRFSPLTAGLYTTASLVGTIFVRDQLVRDPGDGTEDDPVDVAGNLPGVAGTRVRSLAAGEKLLRPLVTAGRTFVTTLRGFYQGAVDMAPLVGVLGVLGVVLTMITQTGLSQRLSFQMISIAGGVLVVLLLLAMITSILFGLGMPTPAAYILVVVLVAPGLTQIGVQDLNAHMFVFYFAMLSAITPPVALAVAVGSRIADCDFLTACKQALRIGLPGFVVPYAFVFNETIIYWEFPGTVVDFALITIGITAMVMATMMYDGRSDLGPVAGALYLFVATPVLLFGPLALRVPVAGLLLVHWLTIYLDKSPSSLGQIPGLYREEGM